MPKAKYKIKSSLRKQELLIEAKAQSGQQHGDKYPRSIDWVMFDPQEESDLKSWLFIERVSSRSGRTMKHMIIEAKEKDTQIFFAQTDFFTSMDDIALQATFICPDCEMIDSKTIQPITGKPIKAHF